MDNINLVRKVAWNFYHKESNLEFDDLFQEAALAYCQAIKSFDPDNGTKLTTYAWWCMRNHLINYVKKIYKKDESVEHIEDEPKNPFRTSVTSKGSIGLEYFETRRDQRLMKYGLTTEQKESIQDVIAQWSKDCQRAVQMAFESPESFLGETPHYKRQDGTPRQRIKDALRNEGWTHKRINDTLREMKTAIHSLPLAS